MIYENYTIAIKTFLFLIPKTAASNVFQSS